MKVFIALTICFTIAYGQNSDTACGEGDNGKLKPVAGDKTKFYHCDNCIGVLKSCAAGTIFSDARQTCIWEGAGCGGAGCGGSTSSPGTGTTRPPPTVAPPPGSTECPDLCPDGQYLPYPDDETKYQVCDNGNIVLMSCPCGLIWNNDLQTCDWKDGACGGVGGCTGCGEGGGSGGCAAKKS